MHSGMMKALFTFKNVAFSLNNASNIDLFTYALGIVISNSLTLVPKR